MYKKYGNYLIKNNTDTIPHLNTCTDIELWRSKICFNKEVQVVYRCLRWNATTISYFLDR